MKKVIRFIKPLMIMLVIGLVLLEIGLRLFGYSTYQLPDYSLTSTPEKHILPDDKFGIHLNSGKYTVTINKKLNYVATHLQNGQRTCGSKDNETKKKPIIAFYGCSFTYGMGINDWEVYPYILQQKFPELLIENHAVPGYGQAQILVDLENQLSQSNKPTIVVLNYISFHNERNAMNNAYQKKIRTGYQMTKLHDPSVTKYDCAYPFGMFEKNKLKTDVISIASINSTFPLIEYSASMNVLQTLRDEKINPEEDERVTIAILDRIHEICKEHQVKLVISYMMTDEVTERLLTHCRTKEIPTINITVDLSRKGFTNAPFDQHPSSKAHAIYASKLSPFLSKVN